jgi:hypothetical protein
LALDLSAQQGIALAAGGIWAFLIAVLILKTRPQKKEPEIIMDAIDEIKEPSTIENDDHIPVSVVERTQLGQAVWENDLSTEQTLDLSDEEVMEVHQGLEFVPEDAGSLPRSVVAEDIKTALEVIKADESVVEVATFESDSNMEQVCAIKEPITVAEDRNLRFRSTWCECPSHLDPITPTPVETQEIETFVAEDISENFVESETSPEMLSLRTSWCDCQEHDLVPQSHGSILAVQLTKEFSMQLRYACEESEIKNLQRTIAKRLTSSILKQELFINNHLELSKALFVPVSAVRLGYDLRQRLKYVAEDVFLKRLEENEMRALGVLGEVVRYLAEEKELGRLNALLDVPDVVIEEELSDVVAEVIDIDTTIAKTIIEYDSGHIILMPFISHTGPAVDEFKTIVQESDNDLLTVEITEPSSIEFLDRSTSEVLVEAETTVESFSDFTMETRSLPQSPPQSENADDISEVCTVENEFYVSNPEVKIVKLVKDTEVYTNANEFYVSNPDVMIVKSLQEENVKLIPVKVNFEAEQSKVNSGSNEILESCELSNYSSLHSFQ